MIWIRERTIWAIKMGGSFKQTNKQRKKNNRLKYAYLLQCTENVGELSLYCIHLHMNSILENGYVSYCV